jgi:hypothetical protein
MNNDQGKDKTAKPRRYNSIRSEERLIEALRKNRGVIAYAATVLGVSRQTVYEYIKNRPHLQAVVDDCRELSLDITEAKLFQSIESGNIQAIIFHLKTVGKDRGYTERSEVTGAQGAEIRVQTIDPLDALGIKPEKMTPEQLDQLESALKAAVAASAEATKRVT